MKSKKQQIAKNFFENFIIDYGILNEKEQVEVNKIVEFIKNDLPNLYNEIGVLAKEATAAHGPITLRFSHENDAMEHRIKVMFGASFNSAMKKINVDFQEDAYGIILNIMFELCNACNKELDAYMRDIFNVKPYNPNLSEKEIANTAIEIEKKEFLSVERLRKIFLNYLTNNKEEITKILSEEEYQEHLNEYKQNFSFDDSMNAEIKDLIDNKPLHTKFYEINIKFYNEFKKIRSEIKESELKFEAKLEIANKKFEEDIQKFAKDCSEKFSMMRKLDNDFDDKFHKANSQNSNKYYELKSSGFNEITTAGISSSLYKLEEINDHNLDLWIKTKEESFELFKNIHLDGNELSDFISFLGSYKAHFDSVEFEQL